MPATAFKFVLTAAFCLVFVLGGSGPASAKIRSYKCAACHTMHREELGAEIPFQTGYQTDAIETPRDRWRLLKTTCIGCHSSEGTESVKGQGTGGLNIPIVFNISKPDYSKTLAGGNFYWVVNGTDIKKEDGSAIDKDRCGHNVYGLSKGDTTLTGNKNRDNCGGRCHGHMARGDEVSEVWGYGCTSCHMYPKHHTGENSLPILRFLRAHGNAYSVSPGGTWSDDAKNFYVVGYGEPNYKSTVAEHNEYKGSKEDWSTSDYERLKVSHSITGFCVGCHTNIPSDLTATTDPRDPTWYVGRVLPIQDNCWLKHPVDYVIPNSNEFVSVFGSNTYNPLVPVGRLWTDDKFTSGCITSEIKAKEAVIMCLTCHRAHGSPYPSMLRWEYKDNTDQPTPTSTQGSCLYCHTKGGTGA
ncbi:MAG: cytochrome c3 family protein [Pseudomonadota bacterium]